MGDPFWPLLVLTHQGISTGIEPPLFGHGSGAKKAREEIQHKEFWGPQEPPPPRNSLCRGFSCILKGKEAPNIKNLWGQESLGRGVWEGGGFCPNSLSLCPFLAPEWTWLKHFQLVSLGFEGHTELFDPHTFTWKTPTPAEDIRTKQFGFGFLFLASQRARRAISTPWGKQVAARQCLPLSYRAITLTAGPILKEEKIRERSWIFPSETATAFLSFSEGRGNFCGRRTNVQQLTCKIDLSSSFYYLFLSFVLLELKPFALKGKSRGKNYEQVWKKVRKRLHEVRLPEKAAERILQLWHCEGPNCTWVKPGRFGRFFVLCFLALGGHCFQMLCLPGFGTRANTQNLPHFRAFTASIQEHSCPLVFLCFWEAF